MKLANIDREIFHIFWTTWGISMKFLGKMWLMSILKVTKTRASPSLWKIYILKNHRSGKRVKLNRAVLGLNIVKEQLTETLANNHLYVKLSYRKQLYLRKNTYLQKDAAFLHFRLKESSENVIFPWNVRIRKRDLFCPSHNFL